MCPRHTHAQAVGWRRTTGALDEIGGYARHGRRLLFRRRSARGGNVSREAAKSFEGGGKQTDTSSALCNGVAACLSRRGREEELVGGKRARRQEAANWLLQQQPVPGRATGRWRGEGGRELLEEARGAVGDAGIQPEKLGAALREVASFPFFFPPRYIRTYSADRGKASLNRRCIGCLSGCNALCFLFLFIVSFVSRAQPERSERVVCFRVPRLRFGQEV